MINGVIGLLSGILLRHMLRNEEWHICLFNHYKQTVYNKISSKSFKALIFKLFK
jgi:hypothetical protein